MAQEALAVKTAPRLVDHGIPEGMCIGQRNGVVSAIILCQSKPGEGVDHRSVGVNFRRRVIHPIKVIPLGKVMVQPQGAEILGRIARQDGLIASRNSSIGRIDRCGKPNLGEIGIDECLDGGIEESRGNHDKSE